MPDQFTWTSPSGVTVTLPTLNDVPSGVIRRHRKSEPVDFVFSMLEEIADEAALVKLDSLSLPEVNALFEAWQEAAAPVGESSGSST